MAMMQFHAKIVELAPIYDWSAVLELALQYHTHIGYTSVLQKEPWETIPDSWISKFCNPASVRMVKRLKPSNEKPSNSPKTANNNSVLCINYNSETGCNWKGCKCKHACSTCGSTSHKATACTAKG
ncbi:hypothetical protein K469DRAFT_707691 [Zopfia rhizophila CBS 207.26]|uniref:Uncharacterized protein n=1 Tax=Zopfia rhizophila CBS 207.26 TaxID=1314779 RepID=A0A6A6E6E4_9PEZI|nr:hypothetical protein K469DRAFT_707691 [Zopfia rhizophila CBS 207.26]